MNSKYFHIAKHAKAFTLIEILLVMLITSVIVLGVNTAFRQANVLWERIENQRPVYQKTRLLFNTLREELSCAYLPSIENQQQPKPAAFSLSTLPDGTVMLSFLTMNPVWNGTDISSLPKKVTYEFSTETDTGKKVLTRIEQLFSGEKPVAAEQREIILDDFFGVELLAGDPDIESLADSWKNQLQCSQKPPKAVKILLKWPKIGQADLKFETIIKIAAEAQLTHL